jgi:parallel beta-helix repeat protein
MLQISRSNIPSLMATLVAWTILASNTFATTYYFSPNGNDSADGKSPARAWKSLGKSASAGLVGGDELLLQRGGMWRETLTIPADGAAGHPIFVSAFGNGDRPCIDGGDPIDPSKFKATDFAGVFSTVVDHKVSAVWQDTGVPLNQAASLIEMRQKDGTFSCDAGQLFIHPGKGMEPGTGKTRYEIPARELGIEIGRSHIVLRSISIRHSARTDRGAITVWADHDLSDIEIHDCDVSYNCGRGAWFCGPATSSIRDVQITDNQILGNDGSGVLLTLADGGQISGNTFTGNCRVAIEPWQAGIRLWSGGIRNLAIRDNTIADERWNHDRDSATGIHCDETGEHMTISGNKIRNVDHAGIAVENTRGVIVEKNNVTNCNIGIFINRAGHDHIIRNNTVADCRSQGLAIQGWLAHGIDAQPEITVDGRLMTRNLFENNTSTGSRYGNLKATNGGEKIDPPLGNIFRNNDLGSERAGFIEWGDRTLDRYDQWPVPGGGSHGK